MEKEHGAMGYDPTLAEINFKWDFNSEFKVSKNKKIKKKNKKTEQNKTIKKTNKQTKKNLHLILKLPWAFETHVLV